VSLSGSRKGLIIKATKNREMMLARNQVQILLFKVFHKLRYGRRIAYLLRELLRILLPSAWRERLRRWRTQVDFFWSDRSLWLFLQKKLIVYAGRLFDSHCYCQEIYGEAPLLTLLVSCDSGGDPLTGLHVGLKKQTWSHFEVIFLVCDGDREFKQKLSAVIAKEGRSGWSVLSADSSFHTGLRNQALGVAQGKYIVSLHNGDDLEPTFLEECLLLLEASPPHFFIQSANRPLELEEEDFGIVDPVASLYKNRFRAVVFPRLVGLSLAGYDETMPTGFKEWEFYVKLIRHGYVGRSLPSRISRGLVCESVSVESNSTGFVLGKKRMQALHLGYIVNHERWLRRRARQYWQVTEPLCNLLLSVGSVKKKAIWLDLVARPAVPASLFARLMARPEDPDIPLIVTIDSRRQSFFRYNKKAGLQVYLAESYHLQGNRDYFYNYLQTSYQLEKVYPEEFLLLPEPGSTNPSENNRKDKLRILYVAPWLITGGADTMTVDWFCQLNSAWSDKYFVTTLFCDNSWLPKIADCAQGIYDLPALGCVDPVAMIDFLLEFIAVQNIDILHIMNSEIAFQALPKLKERFPDLKVVAQFHCFDYFADGRCTGYAFAMPHHYDHFIDCYNLEYAQLGIEIVQLYPNIKSSKFAVIHGRVDSDFYNPAGRLPSTQIATYQRKDALNLLFIGRLDRQKQPLRLLKIAVALRGQGIPFVMHVIGDGNLESQKSEFLVELQGQRLADQVRFYGEQPLETLVDWYLIADVLLLTSDWEGVPMVLYQAMAMAVVPVVANVGGCAELVTPACGYLVLEKENTQAYVSAIQELLNDQRRQEMGALARRRMRDHFSLADLDSEYRTFYESLL
jgi:glycosyltransferase involved in cell wall biosynthesis